MIGSEDKHTFQVINKWWNYSKKTLKKFNIRVLQSFFGCKEIKESVCELEHDDIKNNLHLLTQ